MPTWPVECACRAERVLRNDAQAPAIIFSALEHAVDDQLDKHQGCASTKN